MAATKKESSGASCQACTCGCRRGQTKERRCFRVESVDKFDNSVIAFDCPDEEFRSIEASLYQVLHRTTSNEPLRIVQQTRGQRGFEAWHAIVRRNDLRNMSDKKSAYAALISNISEKDRAKDVEHVDDILRTFINEMNKFESRFGAIRDEEKMLAVKKLMPEEEERQCHTVKSSSHWRTQLLTGYRQFRQAKAGGTTQVLQW